MGKVTPSPSQHVNPLFTYCWNWQLVCGFQTVCAFEDRQWKYQMSFFMCKKMTDVSNMEGTCTSQIPIGGLKSLSIVWIDIL